VLDVGEFDDVDGADGRVGRDGFKTRLDEAADDVVFQSVFRGRL